MAINRARSGEVMVLERMPVEEEVGPAPGRSVVDSLREMWLDMLSDNARGWDDLAAQQAREPTIE